VSLLKENSVPVNTKKTRFLRAAKDHISGGGAVDLRAAGGRAIKGLIIEKKREASQWQMHLSG
jgi:hypothetical protein